MKNIIDHKDALYAGNMDHVSGFVFDNKVAAVFQDMITRSVPGYQTIVAMTGLMAGRFAQPNSYCYDLGCSLCESSLSMSGKINATGCEIMAIDNSPAMLAKAKRKILMYKPSIPIHLICEDIKDIRIINSSVAILNFTLQFIKIEHRAILIKKIFNGMRSGGVLILSEKIGFDDERLAKLHIEMHHSFKRTHGYSDLEISRKRTALENVLIPETIKAHIKRIKLAGFSSCDVWFQCFNFASIIALK